MRTVVVCEVCALRSAAFFAAKFSAPKSSRVVVVAVVWVYPNMRVSITTASKGSRRTYRLIIKVQVPFQIFSHTFDIASTGSMVQDLSPNLILADRTFKGTTLLKEMFHRDRCVGLRLMHDGRLVGDLVNGDCRVDAPFFYSCRRT